MEDWLGSSVALVNISSILGLIPSPYNALYAATKHAIEGYSESLDHELRTLGIRVVLVEPGYTRTNVEAGDKPEVVAEAVVKAATVAVPRRRYTAGKMSGRVSLLRRFVPESAFDKSLRKQNGLPV
jgi:short-subunit dehydrogenase